MRFFRRVEALFEPLEALDLTFLPRVPRKEVEEAEGLGTSAEDTEKGEGLSGGPEEEEKDTDCEECCCCCSSSSSALP